MKAKLATVLFAFAFLFAASSAFAEDNALTGIYVGGHLGLARYTSKSTAHFPFSGASLYDASVSDTGMDYGIQGGQNFAFGKLLYGYVVDLTLAAGVRGEDNDPGVNLYSAKFKSAVSVRAKVGYLLNNKAAVSLTLGPALGRFDITDTVPPCGDCYSSPNKTVVGYVLGLGGEYALKKNLLLSAELAHYGFKKKDRDLYYNNGVPYATYVGSPSPYSYTFTNKVNVLNLAVSYKF